MKRAILAGIALGLFVSIVYGAGSCWAQTSPTPAATTLVRTQAPQQGTIPDTIIAYGTAQPGLNGAATLSLPVDGRILRIDTTPGEAVHAGQHLIEFEFSPQAISVRRQAVSALDFARKERTHTTQLLADQLATRDQMSQANKAVSDAQAALDALSRDGGNLTIIKAPSDGIVSAIPVAQGDRVAAGSPLLTLTKSNGLVVTLGIDPADKMRIRPGQTAHLDAIERKGVQINGRLIRIDNVLNAKTRLIDADIAIQSDQVLAGESFRAIITVGTLHGWLVAQDALASDAGGDFLFQINGDQAVRVSVKRLGVSGDMAIVSGGIDPDRQLVIEGNYQLSDGMKVRMDKARS